MGASRELLEVAQSELLGDFLSDFEGGGLIEKAPMGAFSVSYLKSPREALRSS